ncbi:nucleotidyltransferase domain-containing protein [Candidatus Woesearchaeota archaeon]|nr:nucleotidyltransferase domain-containing protein [Candidatus Woesearchaeota archaeon]
MLQKYSILMVLEVFFIEPSKEHYLMNISRTINIAHTSVKQNLIKLVKRGLINQETQRKGKRNFPVYKANKDNKEFKRYKMIYNITSLLESRLIDFLEEKIAPKAIILFGSYRRGEDLEDSDIDIFIEGIEEKIDLKIFEKKLKRKIQLHFKKDFNTYPKELKNNIINGILLQGFLEAY